MKKKQLNVLLVDDDEINQLVACTFLKKWDIGVTVATNGQKALDLIRKKEFHLVMMDLQMPEMDGYECTKRIRAMGEPYYKNLPIIVFSASYVIDSRQKAMEFGMTDFMNKPFRQEELREKIGQYVTLPTIAFRPLSIDFHLHTDGEPVFKVELMNLLTENLSELKRSLEFSLKTKDPAAFLNASHKVSSAVAILNEPELNSSIEFIRTSFSGSIARDQKAVDEHVNRLNHLVDEITRSMDHEVSTIQKVPQ